MSINALRHVKLGRRLFFPGKLHDEVLISGLALSNWGAQAELRRLISLRNWGKNALRDIQ